MILNTTLYLQNDKEICIDFCFGYCDFVYTIFNAQCFAGRATKLKNNFKFSVVLY